MEKLELPNVIVRDYKGVLVSEEDKAAIVVNFPMWFGAEMLKEMKEKDITIVVLKNQIGNPYIHLTNADEDIITRSQIAFWGFQGY